VTGRAAPASAAVLALLLSAPLLLVGLGRAPFDDPGEGMHAEIAHELLRSGDPLTLNGVRYVDKPPLLYGLLASAFILAGPGEASARAVPAVAALVAVAMTAWLGARLLGATGGSLAGVGLLTSVGFFAYGRYVRPETLFVAALASGFTLTLIGLRDDRRWLVVTGLAAFGIAGLAKDPLGALAPPIALGLALAVTGRARPVRRWLPAAGVATLTVAGAGWWVVAELRTPGTIWYTVVDNHVLNVARARYFPDEDVPLGALAFLLVASLGAAPWVIAAGVAVFDLARAKAWRDPTELPWIALALWLVGVFVLTAISPFRLPHYGLPAYPAVALLAARAWRRGDTRWLLASHGAVFALLAAACGIAWMSDGTVFMPDVMAVTDVATRKSAVESREAPLPPWEAVEPLFGAAGVIFGAGALLTAAVCATRRRWGPRYQIAGASAVVVTMLALLPTVAAGLELVSSHRAVRAIAFEIARHAGPEDLVAHEGPLENSGALEWYSERRPVIVDGGRSVLGFGSTLDDAREMFWEAEQLRLAWGSGRRVWIVTTRAPERSLVPGLPHPRLVTAHSGRRLYVNR
jgi:4-amino-4-deoxy-L-arabinose transferase-like glycosyltransferase